MTRSRSRLVRLTAGVAAAVTVLSTAAAITPPAAAAQPNRRPAVQKTPVLPYHLQSAQPHRLTPTRGPAGPRKNSAWPNANSEEVALARPAGHASSASKQAATIPIRLHSTGLKQAASAETNLSIQMRSRGIAQGVGVDGVLFTLKRVSHSADDIALQLDYRGFANAGGANYGKRLHLVTLPACALTTPKLPRCQVQTPVASTNDATTETVNTTLASSPAKVSATRRVAAQPELTSQAGSMIVMAATAGASGSNDDFTATSLAPSGTWAGGGSSGSFSWSYPILTPPAAAGSDVAPSVALAYDSGSVDGRVASTNNQDGWIGEGWDYTPGYIERTYRSCSDDTDLVKADQLPEDCWAGQVLTFSLGGSSNEIVRDDSDGTYHLKNDDGSRVQLVGAGSGAYQNEYWKITTMSGVQYFFGQDTLPGGSTTNATWTVPVCGDSDTKCSGNGSGTISPIETQAWRWNLDYVIDPHNNATVYHYATETNYYGQMNKTAPKSYIRGGYLTEIDYGMRATSTTLSTPSDKVVFTSAERCVTACTAFDTAHAGNWPDTPQDLDCAATGSCNIHAPTFWSRKRLTTITTQYYAGSGSTYYMVDKYALGQSFPSTGDPELEFDNVIRTGYLAGTALTATSGGLAMPKVGFTYQLLDNRIDGYNAQPTMRMWRLNQVATETGETILISYDQPSRAPSPCTKTTVPSTPSNDTSECYPVYWTPTGYTTPQLDWFHKHLVTQVDVDDINATAPNRSTTYTYLGAPAWHYDDNEVTKPKYRTYGQFRGFAKVETRTGNPNHASNGVPDAWTLSTSTYYQGMDGDSLPGNQTRSASITDSFGNTVADSDQYAGTARETQTFNGDTSAQLTATIATPITVATTATRARTGLPDLSALMVRAGTDTAYTNISGGSTRSTTTNSQYDAIGRLTQESDSGTSVQTLCTTTHYADNSGSWLRDLPSEVIKSAQNCPAYSTAPSPVLSDVRTYYDGSSTLGDVSGKGEPTQSQTETQAGHWATSDTTFDASGRAKTATQHANPTDARTTTTTYTPADGGPLTSTKTSNPKGQATSSTVDPSRGSVLQQIDVAGLRTDATYDAVGRLTAVWKPGQVKGTDPATTTYTYLYSPAAPLATTTQTLVDPGNGVAPGYESSVSIYDAFGNVRQTQSAAPGGGRNVTDNYTDGHGWTTATNARWHTTGSPGTTLITTAQSGIDQSTRTVYDGAGRPTISTEYNGTTPRWSTATFYSGDSTTMVPPNGGVESTSRTDARGNATELDRWTTPPSINGGTVSGGSANKSVYQYDALSRQTQMTTAAGDTTHSATWASHYDLAGRVVQMDDPDTGTTNSTYDDANEVVSTTDASQQTLSFTYDALGRKVGEYSGVGNSAALLDQWSYDTLEAGQLTSSERFTSTGNYTEKVTGYDAYGNPKGSELDLSNPDPGFAASYITSQVWTKTHLVTSETPAAGGGLPSENVHFYYDGFGDPTATTGYTAYVSATSYSPYGEPNQYTLGVNNQTAWLTYARDAQTRRVTGVNLSAQIGTPQLENLTYAYDSAGNVTSTTDTEGAIGTPTETQCYSYDHLDELVQAWSATDNCATDPTTANSNSTVGGPQPYWLTWTLDAGGGRAGQIDHEVTEGSAVSTTTSYLNGVSVPQPHAHAVSSTSINGATSSTYSYNSVGNPTSRIDSGTSQSYSYTPDGHTETITTTPDSGPAGSVSYSYDANGNEIIRRDPASTTLYLQGEEITRDNASGTTTGTRYYSQGNVVVATRIGHGNPSYLLADPHGTEQTSVPTTSTGVGVPVRRHFDPYGNALRNADGSLDSGGSWTGSHDFLGKPSDATTGLDDLGARQYDPTLGRFLQADPIVDSSSQSQLNGYSYALNNPISTSDPNGTDPAPVGCENQACYDCLYANKDCSSSKQYSSQECIAENGGDGAACNNLNETYTIADSAPTAPKYTACKGLRCPAPKSTATVYYYGDLSGMHDDAFTGTDGGLGGLWYLALLFPPAELEEAGLGALDAIDAGLDGAAAGSEVDATTGLDIAAATTGSVDDFTTSLKEMGDLIENGVRLDRVKYGTATKGPGYGTEVHTEMAKYLRETFGEDDVLVEKSFKDDVPVRYGTKGSVRPDAIYLRNGEPAAVIDFKTGSASISSSDLTALRSNLPPNMKFLPVIEIHLGG